MLFTIFLILGIFWFMLNIPVLRGVFMTFGFFMIVIFISTWNKPAQQDQPDNAVTTSVSTTSSSSADVTFKFG